MKNFKSHFSDEFFYDLEPAKIISHKLDSLVNFILGLFCFSFYSSEVTSNQIATEMFVHCQFASKASNWDRLGFTFN